MQSGMRMHDAFERIIPFVSERLQRVGSAVLVGSHERIPLKEDGFKELKPQIGPRLVFVDAGNGEVLKGPNVSVQFVRLYATWYEDNVRVDRDMREMFLVVLAVQKGLDLGFEVTVFDMTGDELKKFSFDAFDPVLSFAQKRASPATVAGHVRKVLELRFVEEICTKLNSGDVVVRDGDLEARGEVMEEVVRSLRTAAQRRGVIIIGLSKTSMLCTDSGHSAVAALRALGPQGAWSYYAGGSVAFVKFHPNTNYVFRCDVFSHNREDWQTAWAALAANAVDPAFLGYPYGLMDADKFAQVPKDELAQLRARFAVQSKEAFKNVEAALDAHDILNTF